MQKPGKSIPPEILESPDQVLTTLGTDGKRLWIYPTLSTGRLYRLRLIVAWFLIALFVLLPIIRINGKPAVLLDLAKREFTFFGTTFFPTDTFILLQIGVLLILGIVLLTALYGRVWCGWGCPQTVYLEFVFRPIERLIEGKEHVRKRRDGQALNFDKFWRKSLKLGIYAFISLGLAHVFLSYFVEWPTLIDWMQQPPTRHWGYFLLAFGLAGLIFFDFAFFREQMCTITCPYARMQSVLQDQKSMIVSYDPGRGEPRGKRKKSAVAENLGDCIDCFACVRTCPTGIDIRDGLQMECVGCTQCIDACDAIMDRIDKPRGLIRYTSEDELDGKPKSRFRPRVVIYSVILLGLMISVTGSILTRQGLDIDIVRAQGAPFTVLEDGRISNRLRLRLRNQAASERSISVALSRPAGAAVQLVGAQPIPLAPGEMKRFDMFVIFDPSSSGQEAIFEITDGNGTFTRSYRLLQPDN